MFSTLQAAFGTWPSERAYDEATGSGQSQAFGVKEGFSFGDDEKISALSAFKLSPKHTPEQDVFIPPFFIPPGQPAAKLSYLEAQALDEPARLRPLRPRNMSRDHGGISAGSFPATNVEALAKEDQYGTDSMDVDRASRSPSPESDRDLVQERESLWSRDARIAFHDMVTADGYVNRYRMHMKKRQRLTHYLEHPDLEPVLCDGSKDHQTKYQAKDWTWQDGKLYRKPESGRVGTFRRHLDETEAWDVLTREHLRSGHLGRDKLRKRLEQRYIGYTLQEIMFVLKECKRCSGHERTAADPQPDDVPAIPQQIRSGNDTTSPLLDQNGSKGPLQRPQTSNAMFP